MKVMSKRKRTQVDLSTAASSRRKDTVVKSPVAKEDHSVEVDSGVSVEGKRKSKEEVEFRKRSQAFVPLWLHDAANHAESQLEGRSSDDIVAPVRTRTANASARSQEGASGLPGPEGAPPRSEWEVSKAGGGYLMGLDPVLSPDEESVELLPFVIDAPNRFSQDSYCWPTDRASRSLRGRPPCMCAL